MPNVYFVKEDKLIEVQAGANLRQVARENGINVYPLPDIPLLANCGGHGMCGKCRVRVDRTDAVKETPRSGPKALIMGIAAKLGPEDPTLVLACQHTVEGDLEVVTAPRTLGWYDHGFYAASKDAPKTS